MSPRQYPLVPSTALMAVTALHEIAESELANADTIRGFAEDILNRIAEQPDTVLTLTPEEVIVMKEEIVKNSDAWIKGGEE